MAAVTPELYKTGLSYSRNPLPDAIDKGLPRFKTGMVTVPASADLNDTVSFDLWALFGITKLLIVREFVETTLDSAVAEGTLITTAVTGTILTVTLTTGTDKARNIIVYGI